jgi:hypothetical protein
VEIAEIFFYGITFGVEPGDFRFPLPTVGSEDGVRRAVVFDHFIFFEDDLVFI